MRANRAFYLARSSHCVRDLTDDTDSMPAV
jgi:hypothetical protein